MPTVSVVIPTYNRRDYVQEAIDSMLAQTYTDYEIIVVDDGSTDGTGDALQARYGDRIRYVWQQNQGESVARNRGIEMAQGEYIGFLDSDDLYLPHKLETQVAVLEPNAEVGMVFGNAWLIDADGERLGDQPRGNQTAAQSFNKTELYFRNPIGGPSTTLIRKGVLDRVGVFDPAIRFGEEWDLWLRIGDDSPLRAQDDIVTCIRRHRGGQSHYPDRRHNARRLEDRVRMLRKAFARDDAPHELRRTALAHHHAQAFIWEQAVGNREAAAQNLRTAMEFDAAFVGDPHKLGQIITNYVSSLMQDDAHLDRHQVAQVLQRILEHHRIVYGCSPRFESSVRGQVYVALSFGAARASEPIQACRYAVLGILHDPHWLTNRGLLKNLAAPVVSLSPMGSSRGWSW